MMELCNCLKDTWVSLCNGFCNIPTWEYAKLCDKKVEIFVLQ